MTTEVTGSKIWNDLENLYNTRPDSITVRLYADGAEYAVQTVTAGIGWTFAFTGLPAHNADGTEIRYTVTEDAVTGYDATLIPAGGDENASCEWEIQMCIRDRLYGRRDEHHRRHVPGGHSERA